MTRKACACKFAGAKLARVPKRGGCVMLIYRWSHDMVSRPVLRIAQRGLFFKILNAHFR